MDALRWETRESIYKGKPNRVLLAAASRDWFSAELAEVFPVRTTVGVHEWLWFASADEVRGIKTRCGAMRATPEEAMSDCEAYVRQCLEHAERGDAR